MGKWSLPTFVEWAAQNPVLNQSSRELGKPAQPAPLYTLRAEPSRLAFPAVYVGQEAGPLALTIENTGHSRVLVREINVPRPFHLITPWKPFFLVRDQIVTILVGILPTTSAGYSGLVVVETNQGIKLAVPVECLLFARKDAP